MKEASKKVSTTLVDSRGNKINGGPNIKQSQAYTKAYGLDVATLYMNSKQSQVIDLEGGHSSQDVIDLDAIMLDQYDATDLWEEARLS